MSFQNWNATIVRVGYSWRNFLIMVIASSVRRGPGGASLAPAAGRRRRPEARAPGGSCASGGQRAGPIGPRIAPRADPARNRRPHRARPADPRGRGWARAPGAVVAHPGPPCRAHRLCVALWGAAPEPGLLRGVAVGAEAHPGGLAIRAVPLRGEPGPCRGPRLRARSIFPRAIGGDPDAPSVVASEPLRPSAWPDAAAARDRRAPDPSRPADRAEVVRMTPDERSAVSLPRAPGRRWRPHRALRRR